MKLGAIPENLFERIILALGLAPTPTLDTLQAIWMARTVMAATRLGVFEALAAYPLTADQVAEQCKSDPAATGKLLISLRASGYLRLSGERYSLRPVARKWMLKAQPGSLYNEMQFHYLEWKWLEHLEQLVITGKGFQIHQDLTDSEWDCYLQACASGAKLSAPEFVDRTPVPDGARQLLDIGGSHGYFSVALCRRYPDLRATILDLPEAVAQTAPLLAREGMGDRVIQRVGNALTDDLGVEKFDVILMSHLLQFFDDATDQDLIRRAALALRPNGCLVIQDVFPIDTTKRIKQRVAFAYLYYALINVSSPRSFQKIARWQAQAGLDPQKPVRFIIVPEMGQQVAIKPGVSG
jgi:SAM-dependent methyltransferase